MRWLELLKSRSQGYRISRSLCKRLRRSTAEARRVPLLRQRPSLKPMDFPLHRYSPSISPRASIDGRHTFIERNQTVCLAPLSCLHQLRPCRAPTTQRFTNFKSRVRQRCAYPLLRMVKCAHIDVSLVARNGVLRVWHQHHPLPTRRVSSGRLLRVCLMCYCPLPDDVLTVAVSRNTASR